MQKFAVIGGKAVGKRGGRLIAVFALLVAIWAVSCAPKRSYVPAAVPAWEVVESIQLSPPEELSSRERAAFGEGWIDLRRGRLEPAAEELERLGRRYRGSPPIATALGFLELRLGNRSGAERYFETALREAPDATAALAGHFLVALAADDETEAYQRLERLMGRAPDHALVERFGTTLRVNVAETRLREARGLVKQERFAEAAEAYVKALEVAPEAGSLYLETAEAELQAGLDERALEHARRAVELEPSNPDALRILGEARYANGDLAGAVEAYREAVSLQPSDQELRGRRDALEDEYEREHLPPEFFDIESSKRLTRAELAALVYVEFRDAFEETTSERSEIATDIAESWASSYIRRVVRADIMEVFPNHTFQPRAFVTRIELARVLARAMARFHPDAFRAARESTRFEQEFPDLSSANVDYEAAALATSLGLLLPGEGGAFEPQELVSGDEAIRATETLAAHMAP